MKIRDKILIQKFYVIVFNGIFLALGLMLLMFGLWLLLDRSNFFSVLLSSGENQLVPYISCILLGIGSAITFTSALGFLGSVLEIKRLLVTYMSFQILVFVTQMAILVLIFVKKEEVHNQWNNRIDEVISEYGNESLAEQEPVWNILNAVQHKMECCGRYNITQWERNKNKDNSTQIPCSCTKSGLKKWFCNVSRDSTYSMGCEEHLSKWFENNILILTAISISLLITQVLLITLTGQLLRNIRKNNIWPNES
ncbi:tetraspanin 19 [Columba livia]|uniref:Tetraspanin n=1 Tax=Columba livia TaxID=8932 RepID=A0A2I0LTL1_COLLI|nr:putative tetraspanin-19 isoform X1 [Columba livia]XP_021139652.1 putative tetraspanin-19 isoform X1 [Columba livia]XP_021139653.1 putative tetraspanin-19 isoform X1 [Columba livia]PKK20775.1 tetraspanin 19 [Columba livia]